MNNTKRFFRQIVYTEDFNDSTISGLFKTLGKRILADIKVVYDSLEFKLQTILEPENEKDLIFKQNRFPTFSSILEVLGTRQKNKFYPANPSLWVVFVSCFMGILIIIFVSILHSQDFITVVYKQFGVAIVGSILCITFWVSLFYKEKVYGYHTDLIRNNITLSFWIFLFTEGLCFMSLFWTFFHSLLAASAHIGQFAPGEGIVNYYLDEDVVMHPYWSVFLFTDMTDVKVHNFPDDITNKYTYDHTLAARFHFNLFDCGQLIDPYGYPALNTALLLISATVLNSGHAKLKMGKYLKSFMFLALTLLLGVIFLCVQFLEIKGCTLQYNDGIYACSFYSLTGLHGIHVILGVFALFLCFINFIKGNYTRKRHSTFWCAVAYWHFVDVVWVLVYLLIYCWPSCLYFSDVIRHSYLGYRDHCLNINIHVFEENLFQQVHTMKSGLILMLMDYYNNTQLENKKKVRILFDKYENTIYKSHGWLNTFFNLDFFIIKMWTIYQSSHDCEIDRKVANWKFKTYPTRADVLSAMIAHIKPEQDSSKSVMEFLNKNSLFKEMIKTAIVDVRKDFDINLSDQDALLFNLSNNKFLAKKFWASLARKILEGHKESHVFFENDKSESLAAAEPEILNVLKEDVKKTCKRSYQFNLLTFRDHLIKNAKNTTNLDIYSNGFDEKFWISLARKILEEHKESHVFFENDKSESLAAAEPEILNVLKEDVKKTCKRSYQSNLLKFRDHFIKNAKNTTNLDINSNGFDELNSWDEKKRTRWRRLLHWMTVMREHSDIKNYIYSFHDVKELQRFIKGENYYDHDVMFKGKHFTNQSYFMMAEAANLMYSCLFDLFKIQKYQDRIDRVGQYKILTYALYHDLYKNKQYINYSEITTDKNLYAFVLNVLHTLAFDYLYKWAYSDLLLEEVK